MPPSFADGFRFLKTVSSREDVARVILTGVGGGRMPSYGREYLEGRLTGRELASVSEYVYDLIRRGEQRVRRGWKGFWRRWSDRYPLLGQEFEGGSRFDVKISRKYRRVSPRLAQRKGCLSCHEGIERMVGDSGKMGLAILSLAGGRRGWDCVVCHQGNPEAFTKEEAHRGMFSDPGSLWVVSFGKGCGVCHTGEHGLRGLQGVDFPLMLGGGPMVVRSRHSDPMGETGHGHVYRVQRSLMSLEYGKATYVLQASGLLGLGEAPYADFAMKDPLGSSPVSGSRLYRNWIHRALSSGEIRLVSQVKAFPMMDELSFSWQRKKGRYVVEYYRKACGRCHLWNRGRFLRGEYRASGCSACHVLYNERGLYLGKDATIPKGVSGHPQFHRLTAKVPHTQCARCHMAIYKHSRFPFTETKAKTGMGVEVHLDRGMECIDCHTSTDVHGDGNIYQSLQYQIEIRCSDCHGTEERYPWQLPLGDIRRAGKGRGVKEVYICQSCSKVFRGGKSCKSCGGDLVLRRFLYTSRGNIKSNIILEGGKGFVIGRISGRRHRIPFLKDRTFAFRRVKGKGGGGYHGNEGYIRKHRLLECYTCHSRQTSRCQTCHLEYQPQGWGTDYLLSARGFFFSSSWRQTKGSFRAWDYKGPQRQRYWRMGFPDLVKGLRGTYKPFQPVCEPLMVRRVGGKSEVFRLLKRTTSQVRLGTPVPHEFNGRPRTCVECHGDGGGASSLGEEDD